MTYEKLTEEQIDEITRTTSANGMSPDTCVALANAFVELRMLRASAEQRSDSVLSAELRKWVMNSAPELQAYASETECVRPGEHLSKVTPFVFQELHELRAFKARVNGYRERLSEKLGRIADTWTELGTWQQALHRIADEAYDGYFDDAVLGEEGT